MKTKSKTKPGYKPQGLTQEAMDAVQIALDRMILAPDAGHMQVVQGIRIVQAIQAQVLARLHREEDAELEHLRGLNAYRSGDSI